MEYRTTVHSQQVSVEPVTIFSVTIKASDAGAGLLAVDNGEGAGAPSVVRLTAPVGESKVYNFEGGLPLGQGLYLDLLNNVDQVNVTYCFTEQE